MDKKKEQPKTKDEALFMTELEDRLRQESKLHALDDGPLIKAAEDWITARGLDPYKSDQTVTLILDFNFLESRRCKIKFSTH